VDEKEVESWTFLPLKKIESLLKQNENLFAPWTREILKWYFKMPSRLELIE